MKIVISPAKSLDFESVLPTKKYSELVFPEKAATIHKVLAQKSPKELCSLMHISDKLGDLNWKRNQEWKQPFTALNARPAVFAFNGDVYTGLDSYTLKEEQLDSLQDSLRILSGWYGLLKPLDLIQPYRLEMGTKIAINSAENLYAFWKEQLTDSLNSELGDDSLFINLASNEYFKVIDTKALKVPVVSPVFKDWKNDKLKIISFYAKKARGLMVRYIMDKNAKTLDDLLGFNYEGYSYSAKETTDPSKPVFIR